MADDRVAPAHLMDAEIERRISEERGVMRAAFEREWAERVAFVGPGAAAPVAARPPERERSTAKLCRPDMYDGKKDNLPDFLYKMELYLDANGIPEETKEAVKLATNYLTSHAFTWWRLREIDVKKPQSEVVEILTWAAFKEAITAQFRLLDQGRRARTMIRSLRQVGSVRAYTQQFQALLLETPETAEVDRIHDYCTGAQEGHPSPSGGATANHCRPSNSDRGHHGHPRLRPAPTSCCGRLRGTHPDGAGAIYYDEQETMAAGPTRQGARGSGATLCGRRPAWGEHFSPGGHGRGRAGRGR